MDISRIELNMNFPEESRVITPAQAVIERVTGSETKEMIRPKEPGVRVNDEKKKLGLTWNYDYCTILTEDPPTYRKGLDKILSVLIRVNEAAPIKTSTLRRLRVIWISPVLQNEFAPLELRYRNCFIKNNDIFSGCYDSGVILEIKRDDFNLHHQSGIMKKEQLQKDFRLFKLDNNIRANVFIFLATTIFSNSTEKYTQQVMVSFIEEAYKICETHANGFEILLEETL